MADGAQKYFQYPFGIDGTRVAVPDTQPVDGSVNYDTGFPIKYEQDPATTGLDIPRNQFNQILYDISQAIQVLQQNGFPFWSSIAAALGPSPYNTNATVRHNGVNYSSLIDANPDEPPSANWQVVSYSSQAFLPGDAVETYSATLPAGWLWMDGKTIGNVTSGGTARANADTLNLFTTLWNSIPNSVLPIQNSDGSTGTRGISALADFSASKRMPVPDKRGRVAAAVDNLGGTAANRLNNFAQGGVDGTILGNAGGEANHALSSSENGPHTHSASSFSITGTSYLKALGQNFNTGAPFIGTIYSGVTPSGAVSNPTGFFELTSDPYTSGAFQPGTLIKSTQVFQNPPGGTAPYFIDGSGLSVTGGTNSSGAGTPHNTVQPTLIANFRIKL